MAGTSRWRRLLEPVLSIGAYSGEPETKRAGGSIRSTGVEPTRDAALNVIASEELYRDANRAQELNVRLVERLRADVAIRRDVDVNDISLIIEQLAAVRVGGKERTRELRQRYLALLLEALTQRQRLRSRGPLPAGRKSASAGTDPARDRPEAQPPLS